MLIMATHKVYLFFPIPIKVKPKQKEITGSRAKGVLSLFLQRKKGWDQGLWPHTSRQKGLEN